MRMSELVFSSRSCTLSKLSFSGSCTWSMVIFAWPLAASNKSRSAGMAMPLALVGRVVGSPGRENRATNC